MILWFIDKQLLDFVHVNICTSFVKNSNALVKVSNKSQNKLNHRTWKR